VTWCGTDEVAATRTPNLEPTSSAQIRFIYAIPSDGTDRFSADVSGIATDAAWMDQWWQSQDPTRTLRFVRFAFPGCATHFGDLDVGFVRLPRTAASYQAQETPTTLITDDLGAPLPDRQKTIVYYDGPTAAPQICGEAPEDESDGGSLAVAVIYLQSSCLTGTSPGEGPSAEIAAHELLHDLGAVPDAAPHSCNSGHVCDSTSDIMAAFYNRGSTLDSVSLDLGRDDYYGHSGAWWDVQDSSWLIHLPQFLVGFGMTGSGSLDVEIGQDETGDCDTVCTPLSVDNGATVTVYGDPAPGWKLAGWTGVACAADLNDCTFTVSQATTVGVTFVQITSRVSVKVIGKGRVTSGPAGISCASSCAHTFAGTAVALRAKAAKGWRFAGWTGPCSGTGTCRLGIGEGGTVRARFVRARK
jgi:hypothetical protein